MVPYDTLLGASHWPWYRMTHFNTWPSWKRIQNLHKFSNYKSIRQHLCFCVDRKCKITYFCVTNNPCRLNVTLLFFGWSFTTILCRSLIKMATISRGYVNLFPPWYFKMTLSYIILVLVLYQGAVFVCQFEMVTNQGPIKLKQMITWQCIQQRNIFQLIKNTKLYA